MTIEEKWEIDDKILEELKKKENGSEFDKNEEKKKNIIMIYKNI